MALQFALRPRIRLAEERERTRAVQVPPIALPVVAYWIVMGVLTYGVSRAPALLDSSSSDAPREPPTLGKDPIAPSPPTRATRASEPPRENTPLELAPTWKDAPREAEPALATRAPVEPATAELAFGPHEERHADRQERHAERPRREAPPSSAHSGVGAPSAWPIVPPPPADLPGRDRVAMRSTLDDLWGEPRAEETPRASSRRDPADVHAAHDTPARAARVAAGSRVSSCESVLAGATDEIDIGAGRRAPDLSRDAYAAILENGSYFSACSVPDGMAIEICAAVQNGRALGVTVISRPSDASVIACVRGAVASLTFPANARLDVTRTRFDAVRGRRAP